MPREPRLGVLGTLVWDTIYPWGASAPLPERWGGIAYSLAGAVAALAPGWTVFPVVKIGSDLASPALRLLRSLPGLAGEAGVRTVPEPNNRVTLRYADAAHRCERLTGGVPAWQPGELEPLLPEIDALYVNFISGFELELATAEWLRRAFRGPIYADLHSLLLGRGAEGHRRPRPLPLADRWLACFDAVQVNEQERALLAGTPDVPGAAGAAHGTPLLLETRGGNGARFTRGASSRFGPGTTAAAGPEPPSTGDVPLPAGPVVGDPTGCGDVWGATCCARLLAGDALEAAMRRAHRAAVRKVSHVGADGLLPHLRTDEPGR